MRLRKRLLLGLLPLHVNGRLRLVRAAAVVNARRGLLGGGLARGDILRRLVNRGRVPVARGALRELLLLLLLLAEGRRGNTRGNLLLLQ